jgi:TPR repeat protein
MKTRAGIGVLLALFAAPCLAGDLEDGVKFQERNDYAKAASAFQKAAAKGNIEAQRRLGFMYYHGEGVAQDNKRAVTLFEKAAGAGDIQSASNLAKMYEFWMGVEQDYKRAVAWYRTAADLGDSASQFAASVMYYKGEGMTRDRIEAAKWWTLAMMKGGDFAETIRSSVESAEAKLTPEEIAEGKRRVADRLKAREARK